MGEANSGRPAANTTIFWDETPCFSGCQCYIPKSIQVIYIHSEPCHASNAYDTTGTTRRFPRADGQRKKGPSLRFARLTALGMQWKNSPESEEQQSYILEV